MLLILTGTVLDSNIPIDKKKYENEELCFEDTKLKKYFFNQNVIEYFEK